MRSLTFGLLVAWLSSHALAAPPETKALRKNVVLVLVDTLRADHLGLYGYERKTSPQLDRLAGSAVVFDRGRSQASCTFISVSSLLTGHYPHRLLPDAEGNLGIPKGHTSMAEILDAEGYATLGVSASSVVRETPTRFNQQGGYGKGFDVFDESCEKASAACVTDRGIELATKSKPPFFLYLHYIDPHAPYRPPEGYERSFSAHGDTPPENGDLRPYAHHLYKKGGAFPRADIGALTDAYDDEIRYWDGEFSRLFEHLRSSGLLEDTIVILTADHGEDFLEHSDLGHCRTVHETSTHIPLILWLPGERQGRRIATPIENVDILPTVLDLVGIEGGPYALDGESARGLISDESTGEERAFASQAQYRSINDERYKLVYDVRSEKSQLYDLQSDPGETHDLSERLPEVHARLSAELARKMAETEEKGAARSLRLGDQMQHKLQALGYIE